ncbi:MAG: hypothetical protein RL143_664 [Pseudomonadota bacterium]
MNPTQAHYLEQLGIQQWLPRAPLPNAPASPDWVYRFVHPAELMGDEEFESALVMGAHAPVAPHAEQRAMAQIHQTLGAGAGADAEDGHGYVEPESTQVAGPTARPSLDSLTGVAEAAPKSEFTPQPTVSIEPAPRYRITMARVGRLLVVDDLPVRGRLGFSDAHKRLLAGIVRSLGEDAAQLTLPITLEWPMFTGKSLDQGPQEALRYAQRQVKFLLREPGVETILMFGQNLPRWVVNAESESGVLTNHAEFGVNYLVTQTLSQALQLPEFKRQIWNDIQPLVPKQ